MESVSYTHLDVYKRQAYRITSHCFGTVLYFVLVVLTRITRNALYPSVVTVTSVHSSILQTFLYSCKDEVQEILIAYLGTPRPIILF